MPKTKARGPEKPTDKTGGAPGQQGLEEPDVTGAGKSGSGATDAPAAEPETASPGLFPMNIGVGMRILRA